MLKTENILCCCSGGKVRSVAAKYLLEDEFGYSRVLTCGLDKTHPDVLDMLIDWADYVIVVGEQRLMDKLMEIQPIGQYIHINVGEDTYGHYGHPKLLEQVRPRIRDASIRST